MGNPGRFSVVVCKLQIYGFRIANVPNMRLLVYLLLVPFVGPETLCMLGNSDSAIKPVLDIFAACVAVLTASSTMSDGNLCRYMLNPENVWARHPTHA